MDFNFFNLGLIWILIMTAIVLSFQGCIAPLTDKNVGDCDDNDAVIYGKDNRKEIYQATFQEQKLARSVVSLWKGYSLHKKPNGEYRAFTYKFGPAKRLDPCERFYEQPAGAFCSGFLANYKGKQYIFTAGHCLDGNSLEDIYFVFDYKMLSPNEAKTTFHPSEVYKGKRVVAFKFDKKTSEDYAVIELERQVTDREPLKLADKDVQRGDFVLTIGHPSGLPVKVADDAVAGFTTNSYIFPYKLDTFGGNSGGPVFHDGKVVGIHVLGYRESFVGDDGEVKYNRISKMSFVNQYGVYISRVKKGIQ